MTNLQLNANAGPRVKRTLVERVFNERGELIEENTNVEYYAEETSLPQAKLPSGGSISGSAPGGTWTVNSEPPNTFS